ncbi:hypothetical protein HYDPIDRAFT_32455 [Hydnomerulius pinastri MD-312]|uniref:Uncharacterized protein n=1 Tax=Hydnomerulius pinastri MD-312 TaxID=994086 RepID=A0A0C9V486_9AGAM|nr:hypothetical protein HYDPIDRAFT_32455 [Hydnomerulius pinastri MD-312]
MRVGTEVKVSSNFLTCSVETQSKKKGLHGVPENRHRHPYIIALTQSLGQWLHPHTDNAPSTSRDDTTSAHEDHEDSEDDRDDDDLDDSEDPLCYVPPIPTPRRICLSEWIEEVGTGPELSRFAVQEPCCMSTPRFRSQSYSFRTTFPEDCASWVSSTSGLLFTANGLGMGVNLASCLPRANEPPAMHLPPSSESQAEQIFLFHINRPTERRVKASLRFLLNHSPGASTVRLFDHLWHLALDLQPETPTSFTIAYLTG